jgi:PAS domain S-box-containing protein
MDETLRPDAELAALLELSGLPVFAVDAQRRITRWSPGMEALTGFAADEVEGLPCLVGVRCTNCLSSCGVYEHGEVHGAPLTVYTRDGAPRAVRKYARVLRDGAGEATGALEVLVPQDSPVAGLGLVAGLPGAVEPAIEPGALDPTEARRIRQALESTRFRREAAAKLLGMSRTTLWRKMREHGIE